MWTLWKAWLLALVMLVSAGVVWIHVGSTTQGARVTTSAQSLDQRASTDERPENHAPRRPLSPASNPLWPSAPASQATTLAAAFQFDRVIVSPISSEWIPVEVVVGDVTGDRRPDVVVTFESISYSKPQGWVLVQIHAQGPDGSLADPLEYEIQTGVNSGSGLELIDLDKDGVSEIAVGNEVGLTILSRRDGHFVLTPYPGQVRALYLATVDADGDGNPDVFAQSWSEGADVYYGDGQGAIRSISHLATSPIGYNIVETSDFTGDGAKDVVMSNGQGWPLVWVYPFKQSAGLQTPLQIDLRPVQTHPPSGMTIADIDGDGRSDLVVSDEGNDIDPKGVRIFYRGAGNGFSRSLFLKTEGSYDRPGAVVVADIDRNGYPDIVTMFNSFDQMAYFLQGPSGFAPVVTQLTDDNPWTNSFYWDNSFAVADVNSDQCPDVVLAEVSSSLRIFYGRNCRVPSPTSVSCKTQRPL